MTNFVKVIQACETAEGAGTKDAIRAALATADPTARRLIREALNPFRVFGIRKYDRPAKYGSPPKSAGSFNVFFDLLDKLVARDLTGNAASEAVTADLARFDEETASYLERIFDKDLKAGFSADTFNLVMLALGEGGNFADKLKSVYKALKTGSKEAFKKNPNYGDLIPTFEVMLAEKCTEEEEFEAIQFPCQADFKYDGERTIAIVEANRIVYYSRSGIEAVHVNGLFDDDLRKMHDSIGDFVLDGERCSDKGFTDTVNAKKSGNDEAKANLRFRAFFLMPLKDWLAQSTKITMRQTREHLRTMISGLKLKKIILTEGREVFNYKDMMNFCNEAIDKPENAIRKIEGLILKQWDAVYAWKRTLSWCKVKRFFDIDARIVGFYPGRPKSRLANTVGGVNCVGFLDDGERVEFNVGSGFDDPQRADMKANPKKWLAATHVIKYQEVTRSKGKKVASLRFCTYERERDDKPVEI